MKGRVKKVFQYLIVIMMVSVSLQADTIKGISKESETIIVKFKPATIGMFDKKNTKNVLSDLKSTSIQKIVFKTKKMRLLERNGDCVAIQLEAGQNVEKIAEELSKSSEVEYAEPLYKVELLDTPNDTNYSDQTYLTRTNITDLWDVAANSDIVVAIVDTGVDYTHDDLLDSISQNEFEIANNGIDDDNNGYIDDRFGYNFYGMSSGSGDPDPIDEQSHGTHLAGIIAAQTNNRLGIAGINPNAKILPVRFLDADGSGNQLDAAYAIYYAVDRGAKIINCSWGYYKLNTVLDEAIQYAVSQGVLVIAAVGNTNSPIVEYPSGCNGVIGIGSATLNNARASYSTYGAQVDFMAYGSTIFSTIPGSKYAVKSGTSQAAAVMSGIVSRILSSNPSLTHDEIYEMLRENSQYKDKKDSRIGYGVVDSNKISLNLQNSDSTDGVDPGDDISDVSESLLIENMLNYPNPIRTSTTFGFDSNLAGADVKINIYDLSGNKVDSIDGISSDGYTKINWEPGLLNNGTYIYIVNVKSASGDKTLKGKLAVLR